MNIELKNGSTLTFFGSDKQISVGTAFKGIVFSEFALQDKTAFDLFRPVVRQNDGFMIVNSTPRGRNHYFDLWEMAKKNDEWFTSLVTARDTDVFTQEVIDSEIAAGLSQEIAEQEFYCSFTRGIEGSYYGRIIDEARKDNRICRVPVEDTLTHVVFDLGMNDSTAMWWWQKIGTEVRIIDYYENNGNPISHYVKIMREKPYIYGDVWLPHDARVRELSSGVSRQDTFRQLGIHARIVPNVPIMDGIEVLRQLLRNCYIDEERCKKGIECLEMYHKEYDAKRGCYCDRPVHDKYSNGSDSGRYLSIANAMGDGLITTNISDLNRQYAARC
jgi:hypothetical protein